LGIRGSPSTLVVVRALNSGEEMTHTAQLNNSVDMGV